MKPTELRDLTDDTLRERIAVLRREGFGLRLQHATGELEDTAGLGRARRDLARAMTVARERGLSLDAPKTTTPTE